MLILSRNLLLIILLLAGAIGGFAQPMAAAEGYYLFPIKPGVRNTLAGTMGELRSSHFHTGIDIRTGGQQGLAVLAAADGYVSRIRVSGGGYGYSLYITHPNGTTTVYAHLKSFRDDIEAYIKEAQYKRQSFEVSLFPDADQFIVSRGDTIALSGNTGSSGGPHLHFDIRDNNHDLLNPLNYGFSEIIDTRAPFVKAIALVPFRENARINGEFERNEFELSLIDGVYTTNDTIYALGEIGLELYAWDRMNDTRFKTGINKIELQVDNEIKFSQHIDSWSFANARSFYQHINYKSLAETGQRYHKLYVDHGNNLSFYDETKSQGRMEIEEGKNYTISIAMYDSYGNMATATLPVYGSREGKKQEAKAYQLGVNRNILLITGDISTSDLALIKINTKAYPTNAAYKTANNLPVFLWDLRKSIPEQIALSDTTLQSHIISLVPSRKEYKVFNEHADVLFNRSSLFDSLAFIMKYGQDTITAPEVFTLGEPDIPLKGTITAMLKPKQKYEQARAAAYQKTGINNFSFVGGSWIDNQLEVKLGAFGDFVILEDSVAPTIKPLILNRERIVFTLDDALSGIKEVKAFVNGDWLLMASDPKRKQYWAEGKTPSSTYQGDFHLEVTDNANNSKTYTTKIR